MKIIDAFTFFNELDTLKIRLGMLYDKVDQFVICESNITHSGIPKPYNFLETKEEFAPWLDKIHFLKYEPFTENLDFSMRDKFFNPNSATWKVEVGQRNFLSSYLITQELKDVAVICDVDEIWNPNLVDFIKEGRINFDAARLEMQFHYYYLNCFGVGAKNSKWTSSFLAKIPYIKNNPNLSQIRVGSKLPIIGNAGWHFSYLGGAKKVSEKIHAFAHQETNTEEINNLEHLDRCIHLGIDHLNRSDHEWAFRPVDCYPSGLRDQMRKFPELIRSYLA